MDIETSIRGKFEEILMKVSLIIKHHTKKIFDFGSLLAPLLYTPDTAATVDLREGVQFGGSLSATADVPTVTSQEKDRNLFFETVQKCLLPLVWDLGKTSYNNNSGNSDNSGNHEVNMKTDGKWSKDEMQYQQTLKCLKLVATCEQVTQWSLPSFGPINNNISTGNNNINDQITSAINNNNNKKKKVSSKENNNNINEFNEDLNKYSNVMDNIAITLNRSFLYIMSNLIQQNWPEFISAQRQQAIRILGHVVNLLFESDLKKFLPKVSLGFKNNLTIYI